jgi:hypothetical protein
LATQATKQSKKACSATTHETLFIVEALDVKISGWGKLCMAKLNFLPNVKVAAIGKVDVITSF